jgi:hypothetical protein
MFGRWEKYFMNKVYCGIIAVLAVTSICAGQKERTRQVTLTSGTRITAELQKSIDTDSAKVGDEVVLKTTQSIRQNGEVVVQKGSRLIGRITDVSRRTKDTAESSIGLVFDRIQGKQLAIPLNATIVSIMNATAASRIDDSAMSDMSGSATTTTRSTTSSGGGLLGGVTNTVGGVVDTTRQTVGGVTNTVSRTADRTTGTVGGTVSGLRISTSASGSANSSTTLSTPNKDLRVEKGATFDLRIAN